MAGFVRITSDVAPALADDIEDQLTRSRLTENKFHIESICSAAQVLAREIPFIVSTFHERRFVVPYNSASVLDQIEHLARARVSHWGVTTVEDLAAATNTTLPFVVKVVTTIPGFRWLDELSGWFWIDNVPRNSLLTQIRKILAVSPKISIGELRTGVGRNHRRKGFAPPRRVLLELCRQLPWCSAADDVITAVPLLNPIDILSDSEQTILQVFKDHGPVMQRSRFEEKCLTAGMNQHSFWIYLSYSPIISRYAQGVFGLRGADVPTGLVESLIPKQMSKSKVLVDFGWSGDGDLHVVYKLSRAMLTSGVVSVPSALKRFLQGKFTLITGDNSHVGTLVAKDNSAWGLGPFFSRRGGEPGDYLEIDFKPSQRIAMIQVGDESLADQFASSTASVAATEITNVAENPTTTKDEISV